MDPQGGCRGGGGAEWSGGEKAHQLCLLKNHQWTPRKQLPLSKEGWNPIKWG
jgi:hypothetical protein